MFSHLSAFASLEFGGDWRCSWNLPFVRAKDVLCLEGATLTASSTLACLEVFVSTLNLGLGFCFAYGLDIACCVVKLNLGLEVSSYGVVFANPMRDRRMKESATDVAEPFRLPCPTSASSGITAGVDVDKSNPLRRHSSEEGLGVGREFIDVLD